LLLFINSVKTHLFIVLYAVLFMTCNSLFLSAFMLLLSIMQYPAGTPEVALTTSDGSGINVLSSTVGEQVGYRRSAFIGSCKHQVWKAIRASSAAPYYLDDFSDGTDLSAVVCIKFAVFKS